MNIDAHWHVIVPEMTRPAAGGEPWRPSVRWENGIQLVELGGRVLRSAVSEFVRIDRILDKARSRQVDHVLLCPWVNLLPNTLPVDQAVDVCRLQNEGLSAAAQAHPERISALGALPLQDPVRAASELPRLMKLPGMKGVELTASVNGTYLGDDSFLPLWEAAESEGALLFIHPTTRGFELPVFDNYYLWNTIANPMETTVTAAHMVMAGVLERFPRLSVVLAHGGGALLALRGRLRQVAEVRPDAASRLRSPADESIRRFYFDTLTHDGALLRSLIEFAGVDHVLLGSDYPFDMGTDRAVDEVLALELDKAEQDAILGGNARRLLRIGSDKTGAGEAAASASHVQGSNQRD